MLLVGLLLNSLLGGLNPLAALVIAGLAVKEVREAWCGETCCAVPAAGVPAADECCAPGDA